MPRFAAAGARPHAPCRRWCWRRSPWAGGSRRSAAPGGGFAAAAVAYAVAGDRLCLRVGTAGRRLGAPALKPRRPVSYLSCSDGTRPPHPGSDRRAGHRLRRRQQRSGQRRVADDPHHPRHHRDPGDGSDDNGDVVGAATSAAAHQHETHAGHRRQTQGRPAEAAHRLEADPVRRAAAGGDGGLREAPLRDRQLAARPPARDRRALHRQQHLLVGLEHVRRGRRPTPSCTSCRATAPTSSSTTTARSTSSCP